MADWTPSTLKNHCSHLKDIFNCLASANKT
jgi:hypothetical protein